MATLSISLRMLLVKFIGLRFSGLSGFFGGFGSGMTKTFLTLFYMGGGPMDPPWQFFDHGSSVNASNELIFHDFVPFNNQQDLAQPFSDFFSTF